MADQPDAPEPRQKQNWLNNLLRERTKSNDTIAANVGSGAENVVVGKNIIQIGSIKIPRWLGLLILGLLVVLVVIGGVIVRSSWYTQAVLVSLQATPTVTQTPLPTATPTVTPTYTATPTLTATPTPRKMNGHFNIAVARFGYKDAENKLSESLLGALLSNWVANTLNGALFRQSFIPDFLVWHDEVNLPASNPPIGVIGDTDTARILLQDNNIAANMVIFGTLDNPKDPASLMLDFVYKNPQIDNEPNSDIGRQRLGSGIPIPAAFQETVDENADLFVRAQAVVWLSRGLAKEVAGRYEEALAIFLDAEQKLPKWKEGKEVLYYFQGREAFYLRKLGLAEEKFNLAIESRPDYVSAYLGLGNVYLERAQLRMQLEQPAGDVAACEVVDPLAEVIRQAQANERISATISDTITDTTTAIDFYRQAVSNTAPFEWKPSIDMANYALANGLRTRGDINISLQNLPAAEEDAKAAAAIFEPLFQRFEDRQENGYLAYSYYGLGQTERALAFFHESRGETTEARRAFESAMTHFSSCSDLKDQVDADGGTRLQNNVSCYCQFWSGKVEEHLQSLPASDEGGVG